MSQKVEIEMINSAFEVRDTMSELIDRGFDVKVKASGAMVIITASRLMDVDDEDGPTIH